MSMHTEQSPFVDQRVHLASSPTDRMEQVYSMLPGQLKKRCGSARLRAYLNNTINGSSLPYSEGELRGHLGTLEMQGRANYVSGEGWRKC